MTDIFTKLILLLVFVFPYTTQLIAQDTIQIQHNYYKETALFSGYMLNTGNKENKSSHIIEIGIWKTKYVTHIEPVNINYYLSNEFLLHDSNLLSDLKLDVLLDFGCFA